MFGVRSPGQTRLQPSQDRNHRVYAVPGLWARMKPVESRTKPLSWIEFLDNGVDTMTGRTPASEAITLVMVLPFLIFCWALSVATIAAFVR